ncbi:MAG TPA: hypothetical protein VE907_12910 [Gammaproteobacteria bacterium]|nr:hypothetical protein [Gammaproteobacteria bacterium]
MKSLEGFVHAGQTAQAAVDALAITAQLKLAREHVDAARALLRLSAGYPQDELGAALRELDALGRALALHFERFAARGSRYACTCGYELTGHELSVFLDRLEGRPAPDSIPCGTYARRGCGGVAVRMSS